MVSINKKSSQPVKEGMRHATFTLTPQCIDKLAEISGPINLNGRTVQAEGGELPVFDVSALKTRFDDVIDSKYGGAASVAPQEFTEIGRQINVSRERVRQLEAKAILKLRTMTNHQQAA